MPADPPFDLSSRAAVPLAEVLAEAPQLTRVDRKYLLDLATVDALLAALPASYGVLTIAGPAVHRLPSTYFDTPTWPPPAHVQQRRRRWKARSRLYVEDGLCRIEVKAKDGRGVTTKTVADADVAGYGLLGRARPAFARRGSPPTGPPPTSPGWSRPRGRLPPHRAADTTKELRVTWTTRSGHGSTTTPCGSTGLHLVETKGAPSGPADLCFPASAPAPASSASTSPPPRWCATTSPTTTYVACTAASCTPPAPCRPSKGVRMRSPAVTSPCVVVAVVAVLAGILGLSPWAGAGQPVGEGPDRGGPAAHPVRRRRGRAHPRGRSSAQAARAHTLMQQWWAATATPRTTPPSSPGSSGPCPAAERRPARRRGGRGAEDRPARDAAGVARRRPGWRRRQEGRLEALRARPGRAALRRRRRRAQAGVKDMLKMSKTVADTLGTRYQQSAPYVLHPALRPDHVVEAGQVCPCSYPSRTPPRAPPPRRTSAARDPHRAAEYAWMPAEIDWSRVYMAGHVPSDLTGGALLGDMIGEYFALPARRLRGVKPFLLLGTRDEDAAADNEYDAFLGFTGCRVAAAPGPARAAAARPGRPRRVVRDPRSAAARSTPATTTRPSRRCSAASRPSARPARRGGRPGLPVPRRLLRHRRARHPPRRHRRRHHAEPISRVPVTLTPRAGPTRCSPTCPDVRRVRRAQGGRRDLPRTPSCWPPRPPARCRRSGWPARLRHQFHPELDIHGLCSRIEV